MTDSLSPEAVAQSLDRLRNKQELTYLEYDDAFEPIVAAARAWLADQENSETPTYEVRWTASEGRRRREFPTEEEARIHFGRMKGAFGVNTEPVELWLVERKLI